MSQPRQASSFEFALTLAKAVLLKHDRRRIDDDDAGIAINDHPVVLADDPTGLSRTDYRGNIETARHDGSVGRLATDVCNEPGEDTALELKHVGRRDIVGNQHKRILA